MKESVKYEMKDFFKMFSFNEMRTKTKKGKKESNGFINKATKTIKKKVKILLKQLDHF